MDRGHAAESTVLSTIILASVLLVLIGIAFFAANNAVTAQVENVQFDQAKNVLLSLDQIVKKGMLVPQSYGYIRTSFLNTIPQFHYSGEDLLLTVSGYENHTYEIQTNIIQIRGGSHVGVLEPQIVRGEESLILTSASSSLGCVKVLQSNGACVSLDYARVRCIYAGVSNYYNGTGWDENGSNVFEITLMNVTFGTFEVGTQAYITVRNVGVNAASTIQAPKEASIHVSLGGEESSCTLADLVASYGGDPDRAAVIRVIIVNVEVSILNGG